MSFSSVLFLAFLAAAAFIAYITPRKIRYVWLLICSYAFYLYHDDFLAKPLANLPVLALLIVTTLITFAFALLMENTTKQWVKRLFMVISLLVCVGTLVAFKYYDFFVIGVAALLGVKDGTLLPLLSLVAPLGISYYILQSVGYTLDVYFNVQVAERNPVRYALFISFFPSIVTGPINRAALMLPQYKEPPKFQYHRITGGLFRILWGIFKTKVISQNLSEFTGTVFENLGKSTGPETLAAALLFAYQLYIDFSGSCDIAIGAAHLLGFDFSENFKRPFAAKTYSALWQRWHISLTSFFRDYLFPPIVWSRWTEKLPFIGKNFTKPPAFSATVIIFAISGLWHGPNVYYIIWGLINGFMLAFAKLFSKKREKLASSIPIYRNKYVRGFFQRIFVYLMFAGSLIFFAAALLDFSPLDWVSRLTGGWELLQTGKAFQYSSRAGGLTAVSWVVLAVSTLIVEIVEKFALTTTTNISLWIRQRGWLVRWFLYLLLLLMLLFFANLDPSKYIYQQY